MTAAPFTSHNIHYMLLTMQGLTGHSTPVTSVTFDQNEEVVGAGSHGGSIRLFDLEKATGRFCMVNGSVLACASAQMLDHAVRGR